MKHVQKVQDDLIDEIQSRGLLFVMQWLDGWISRAAAAQVADELAAQKESFKDLPAEAQLIARELTLADMLSREAQGVSNYSTSQGTNLYRQATTAALASEMRKATGPAAELAKFTQAANRRAWEEWEVRFRPKTKS